MNSDVGACVSACVTTLLHNLLDTFYGLKRNKMRKNKLHQFPNYTH